jgi:hypothetical protein
MTEGEDKRGRGTPHLLGRRQVAARPHAHGPRHGSGGEGRRRGVDRSRRVVR